ncbi:branched-chain amino acid transport system substrate-binding protein [Maritalea mobilis]|uniref:Branched-chain amino acid transport system substrate-binding protein n=1 Tax=Maritalea mobilis TaxID=483324 RepID=A0A4R6VWB6_9HYPH|nr:transporter substrate-binding protein [Maritalea mobilis]TDQ67107.1 branched-chain amino acid transport system substrate-binding protein [Maritalea mobilis]
MSKQIPIGLLFSVTGTDKNIGIDALDGAMMALEEVNADPNFDFEFVPQVRDPGDSLSLFRRYADELLTEHNCRNIIGTVTSSSRKEVIPVVEKHDALLWYCCPYEGFESCENVIYIGSTPSLHMVPLFEYVVPRFGANAYIAGSNYIWGWETGRVARELLTACKGQVHGERYIPIGSEDIGRLIDEIEQKRPDFVLNNLIGNSSYAFFEAYRKLGERDPYFLPENCPIVSCNITEAEIDSIGVKQLMGHFTTAVYFETQPNAENQIMLDAVHKRYGEARRGSTYMVSNYTAIKMLASAIKDTDSDRINEVRSNLHARKFDTALGPLKIDQWTNHAALRPGVGKFDGLGFEIVAAADELVEADPYFVHFEARDFARKIADSQKSTPHLRVVK